MGSADPYAFPIDVGRYRAADAGWLDELDQLAVHAGLPHQRMGTRAIDERAWFGFDTLRDSELALRRRLFSEATDEVFAALPGTEDGCAEAAALVRGWLLAHQPGAMAAWDEDVSHPLARAGLAVQDDLCLMVRDESGWRLGAALLCFPSYWRLHDKLGHLQQDIHRPVPHFAADLEVKLTRFFDRLAPGRIVSRRNWGFSAHPLLFAPDLSALVQPAGFHPDHVWLRSELQTLRRLHGSGDLLFTIRVQLAPATALLGRAQLAGRFADAIAGWSPELAANRGGRHGWLDELSNWLRSIGPDRTATS